MTKEEKDAKYLKVKINSKIYSNKLGWLHGFTMSSQSVKSLGPDFQITIPPHGVAIIETENSQCILVEVSDFTFID